MELIGGIDSYHQTTVNGWVSDPSVALQVFYQEQVIDEFIPASIGQNIPSAYPFIYKISPRYLDGSAHQLDFRFKSTGSALTNSPIVIQFLYESLYTPFHTTDLTGHRVLVLAPHADDETFACGGSLALHRQTDDRVKVVVLTDGSKGDIKIEGTNDYINIRQQEAQQACNVLGVVDIEFWDSPDRSLAKDKNVYNQLANLLETYRPSLIYAPSPLEYHPDHQATAYHLWQVVQASQLDIKIAFWGINRPLKNNALIDVSSVITKKQRASEIYLSQQKNHPYTDIMLGLDRFTSLPVSARCDYVEGYFLVDAEVIRSHPFRHFATLQILTNMGDDYYNGFLDVENINLTLTHDTNDRETHIQKLEKANQQLLAHNQYLEHEVNNPSLVRGLYRSIIPQQLRLYLNKILRNDRRQKNSST